MIKATLRQDLLKQLCHFPKAAKSAADEQLLERLCQTASYRRAETLATYLSLPHECNTKPLIDRALTDGKRVVVPKVISAGQMVFMDYNSQHLSPGPFGILEPDCGQPIAPSEIDLIHVPGLGFNAQGFRIGYGGGFYDRYLANFSGQTLATLYSFQSVEWSPNSHDVAVKEMLIDDNH